VGAIVGAALGSVVLVLIALLALVFCIKKHKSKEIGPLATRGSRPADTDDSRFSVL
jgi:Na+-driven multidrug efflux pump